MRTAVMLLVICGVIAALCATLLVRVLVRPRPTIAKTADENVELLIATKTLPAMTIVDGPATVTKTVKKTEAPAGALTNSVQVVGKVLTRPMAEGEVFTKSSFSTDQKGVSFAAAITEGKRAVTISLQDHNGMAGILYPGSVVDVLVTLMGPNSSTREAVSTTVLQGLQVIGIGSQTVAAEDEFKDKNPGALAKQGQVNTRMVTLLVTPKQAEMLQLATKFGSVSLSMRNPRDSKPVQQDLTRMADFTRNTDRMGTNIAKALASMLKSMPPPAPKAVAVAAAAKDPFAEPKEKEKDPTWETIILRGSSQEKRTFPLSEVQQAEADTSVKGADRAQTAAGVANLRQSR